MAKKQNKQYAGFCVQLYIVFYYPKIKFKMSRLMRGLNFEWNKIFVWSY